MSDKVALLIVDRGAGDMSRALYKSFEGAQRAVRDMVTRAIFAPGYALTLEDELRIESEMARANSDPVGWYLDAGGISYEIFELELVDVQLLEIRN